MTSLLEQLASPKNGLDLQPPESPIAEYFALSKAPGGARTIRAPHHGVKIGVNGVPAPRRAPLKTVSPRQLNCSALAWSAADKGVPLCWEDQLKQPDVRLVVPRQKDTRMREQTAAERHAAIYDHAATRTPRPKLCNRSMPNRMDERNFLFLFGQSKVLQNSRPFSGDVLQQPVPQQQSQQLAQQSQQSLQQNQQLLQQSQQLLQQNQQPPQQSQQSLQQSQQLLQQNQQLQQNYRPLDTALSELPSLSGRALSQWLPPRPLATPVPKSILRAAQSSTPRSGPCPRVNFGRTLDLTLRSASAAPPPSRQGSATAASSYRTPRCSPRAAEVGSDKLFLNFVSPVVQLQKPFGHTKARSAPGSRLAARQRIVYGNDGMPPLDFQRRRSVVPETPALPCTPETEPEGGDGGSAETEGEVAMPYVSVTFGDKGSSTS